MDDQPLRICHLITRMIIGGAQENTLLTVRGLMERGHSVVLASGPTSGPEGDLLGTSPLPGLRLVEEPSLIRELRPRTDLRALRNLSRMFRERNFDVVHTHSSKAGILGRIAAHRAGVPVVIHTVHGQAFHPYEAWWRNRLYIAAERIAARRSHLILAVAQAMVDQCVAARVAPRDKYAVVYSGMEMSPYIETKPDPELRHSLGIPPDCRVVGKIARLFELKGHDYLIEAAARIVAEFPPTRFLLVGDGILRSRLEAEIAARGLAGNFVFAGLVPPAEVPAYTALMDVLVHLSLREGLPRTVVQALAAAVPAVGFNLDGTPEVIRDGVTGFLCRPGDTGEVAEAVLRLLRDPAEAQRMGQRGRSLVRERFDWRRMVDSIEAHYRNCLSPVHG